MSKKVNLQKRRKIHLKVSVSQFKVWHSLDWGVTRLDAYFSVDFFFYDIFWVFGTDVMVTVAKSFDAPIKLLFPKSLWAAEYQFSMLGLGDIVIPGVFIALLLRYDHHRNASKEDTKNTTPYFHNTLVGYFVGLATTIFVMHTFQAAQPALLYLVPTCIGASLGTSVVLGDLSGLFAYSEEEKETKKKEKKIT